MTVRAILPFLLWAMLTLGCSSQPQPVRPSIQNGVEQEIRAYGFGLHVLPGSERLLRGETSNDGAALVGSGEQASRAVYSGAQGAGAVSPGAAAAGLVLGSMLVAHLGESKVHDQLAKAAQVRVAGLQHVLSEQGLDQWFEATFTDSLVRADFNQQASSPYVLRIAPQAVLAEDARSVRLISEISLLFGREVHYQGRIEVISPALQSDSVPCDCIERWSADGALAYKQALARNIDETLRLWWLDVQSTRFDKLNAAEKTLAYEVGESRYVERGRLVEVNDQRSVYLSLQGWLKSVPVALNP